ncbi:MAG: hypothetical protein GXX02_05120 [Syntrophomonadaceae bacterium]|nr:hypothetical protein [Syntrophomonadaceae bacterium]
MGSSLPSLPETVPVLPTSKAYTPAGGELSVSEVPIQKEAAGTARAK